MIAWYWLLPAASFFGVSGLLLGGACAAKGRADEHIEWIKETQGYRDEVVRVRKLLAIMGGVEG